MKIKIFSLCILIFSVIYFCFIIFNSHGYIKVRELEKQKEINLAEHDRINGDIVNLSRKVLRMKKDRSYIEYIMKKEFNLVSDNEIIIYIKE